MNVSRIVAWGLFSGISGTPTSPINRDSGTSGDNLGMSKNDERLEDRGLGSFWNLWNADILNKS